MMSPADDSDREERQPRITLLDDDNNDNNNNSDRFTLRIHESGTKAGKETLVHVSRFDTVAALKRAVVLACRSGDSNNINPNNYYVRLIAAGRLLAPDHARLTQFALRGRPVIHAVIVDDDDHGGRSKKGAQAALQQGQALSRRALRATGVNEAGWAVRRTPEDDEEDDDEDDDEMEVDHLMFGRVHEHDDAAMIDLEAGHARRRGFPAGGNLPLGFDRLRVTAGLGRADVMALRIYFNSHIDRWIQQQEQQQQEDGEAPPPYARERDALRRRRLQEEAWMDAQGPASEFRLNLNLHSTAVTAPATAAAAAASTMITNPTLRLPEGSVLRGSTSVGTDRDFLWGFLLGFFVGFLMLIWIWLPTVPHKQKLGILTGYSFHLALGMLKGGNGPNDEDGIVVLD